jgi:glycosyltransferase involved in cell wall biosynthesis
MTSDAVPNLSSGHISLTGRSVTLVMPCLNEEAAITDCVTRALRTFAEAGLDGHVLVVDNGSTDASVERALAAGARVIHQSERGYGAALRSGFAAATTEFVIMADADGTYELEAMPRLLAPLVAGEADMVMGSRLQHATNVTMPWLHRWVGTPAISFLVNRASQHRLSIRDSQSGFRAFRRTMLNELALSSTGMEFASEMLIRCAWSDFRIAEVDTTYAERVGESKLNTFTDGFRHLRQILLLSPDAVMGVPGAALTLFAFVLWSVALMNASTFPHVGELAWTTSQLAAVSCVLGVSMYCLGLALRYRAESLGLRRGHIKLPVAQLMRRFGIVGAVCVVTSVAGSVWFVANLHYHYWLPSNSALEAFSSFLLSLLLLGCMLSSAPFVAPFLVRPPRPELPAFRDESGRS